MKKIVALFVVLALGLLGFVVFSAFNKGTVEITIDNNDPVSNVVTINDQRVFPAGEGGKYYSTSTSPSSELKIKISGPKIESIEETVSLDAQETIQRSYTTVPVDVESLLNTLGKSVSPSNLIKSRDFGSANDWIVIFIDQGSRSLHDETCILNYSPEMLGWTIVECGERVSAGNPVLVDSPEELKRYLDENADD